MSAGSGTLLIRNADVGGRSGMGIRVGPRRIVTIGTGLRRRAGEAVLDAAGGAVIPGLHDHHVHLRAAVAARRSADVSGAADPSGFDRLIMAAARAAGPVGWLRATGWNEHRAGPLDRRRLDALTGPVPARVQHRSGAMWVLNTAALRAVGGGDYALPGIERADDGLPTGRLLRMDAWLRGRLPAGMSDGEFAAGLATLAAWSARHGITGFTDATPGRDQADADEFGRLSAAGVLPQRLMLMAPPGVHAPTADRVTMGSLKIILDDLTLPASDELATVISDARRHGSGVAVHCVTADQLVVAVAAFEQCASVGGRTRPADRIEHAGVVPPGYAGRLAGLGLAVVTEPGFIADRGDVYRSHVPAAEQGWLYPCASLAAAGVAVAAGTDAPFGPADPWQCISAAVSRRTPDGRVLGASERVSAARALRLFQAAPEDVRRPRTIEAGQPSDLCVLREPLDQVLLAPAADKVSATVIGGRIVAAK